MVKAALAEDIGSGDLTAQLLPENTTVNAQVITRENMVCCGQAWVEEAFKQVDPGTQVTWHVQDGEGVSAGTTLFFVTGNARSLMTAERTALNFLQLLSATATITKTYVDRIAHTSCKLLDTRKTLPLYREAQKYAVRCGGGHNHRAGLFDAFLVKENHILAAGSLTAAVVQARQINDAVCLEVEVENLPELQQALDAQVDRVMLDNFPLADITKAVALAQGQVALEVSGNVTLDNIAEYAETGVDFISVGAITKHIQAIDLSMRVMSS